MTMKRVLIMVLAVLCLVSTLPVSAAEWVEKEGDGFTYHPTDTYVDIYEYTGFDKAEVIFPAEVDGLPVRHIGNTNNMYRTESDPFEEHPEVTRIVIPEGVTIVASLGCTFPNLQEVVLPQSLRAIALGAFTNCPQLKTLTIPSGVALMHHAAETFSPGITLRAEAGSYVERYATHNELAFEPIVYEVSRGDLDADGLCTTTDARLILQYTVDKATVDEAFADVDGDGKVTTTDARLCLQYAVGKAELVMDVPATRPSGNLISSAAQVYAEFHLQEEYRPYGPVSDRAGAIQTANKIASHSYKMRNDYYYGVIEKRFVFVEPNGTTITIRFQSTNEILFEGVLFTGISGYGDLFATV